MASFVKKIFLLAIVLACLIHFGAAYTLIPGIAVEDNCTTPQRLEIRTFVQDSNRRNIFLIALERMQQIPTDQLLSYYLISGIHGTNLPWDNDTGGNYPNGYGYCYHGDALFLPWHRPYLSLYEKTLLDLATEIVQGFPAGTYKNNHLETLKTWRIPYWDWAMDARIPSIMSSKTVSVKRMENGTLKTISIPNPLSSYRLQIPDDPNVAIFAPLPSTIQTVRNPNVQNDTYVTRPGFTNNQMLNVGPDLKQGVYSAFVDGTSYTAFSIEGVHGTVHVVVGGNEGHMTYINYAGFDPMFYLHHANVDRLFAMWQVLYPDSYISNDTLEFPNKDTELHPFRKTDSQYWTPELARNVTTFGYTYPELANFDQQTVINAINDLYNSTPPVSRRRKRAFTLSIDATTPSATSNLSRTTTGLLNTITSRLTVTTTAGSATKTATIPRTTSATTIPRTTPTTTIPKTTSIKTTTSTTTTTTTTRPTFSASYNQYLALFQIPTTVVNGPFLVCAFLGKPSSDQSDCTTDPNYAGLFGVFAPKGGFRSHMKSMQRAISLTNALDERFGVKWSQDSKSEMIRDYLSANLNLRIVAGQDASFDTSGIRIDVVTAKLYLPYDRNSLPVSGSSESIYKVTESDVASKTDFLTVSREISTVDELEIVDSTSWTDDLEDSEASTSSPNPATVSEKLSVVSDIF